MSHFAKGKLKLKCSIDILRRALIRIMPEWEQHIKVDASGRIPIYSYTGVLLEGEGQHVMIPGIGNPNFKGAPGLRYNDLGFRHEEDGSWSIQIDQSGMTKVKHIEEQLCGEVLRMRAVALAKLRGYNILRDTSDEEETITDIEVSKETARQLMA